MNIENVNNNFNFLNFLILFLKVQLRRISELPNAQSKVFGHSSPDSLRKVQFLKNNI